MDRRIAWAIEQMQERLDTPLTVMDLAPGVNLSASRFAHLFQRETGTSPARYLHALRMTRARVLLEQSFLMVKQVMHMVGCHDPSHFARDFRAAHGLSPSGCRTAARRPHHDDHATPGENSTVHDGGAASAK